MFASRAEYLEKPSTVSTSRWSKLAAVQRWLHEHPISAAGDHELLIWIDDDIGNSIRSGEIPAQLRSDPRLVMISPAIHTGINPDELALLRKLTRLS